MDRAEFYSPDCARLLAEAAKTAEHETPEHAAFVEVGVWRGHTADILAHYRGNHELWLVDSLVLEGANRAEWPSGNGIVHLDSVDAAWPVTRVGLLHEDSAHTLAVTLEHLEKLGSMVVVGGLLAIHDFHDDYPEVAQAWLAWPDHEKFKRWEVVDRLSVFKRTR